MKGIIGAICGDIIGSTHEFKPIKTKKFKLITEEKVFTDDTVLTLAVASWLINDEERTSNALVKEIKSICNKYPYAGYGGRFRNWINSENTFAYNSWGNGSAMRVSPVAWVADSLQQAQELAKISANVTHNHPEGVKGAVATASAIYLARSGETKDTIKSYIEEQYGYDLSNSLDSIRLSYGSEVSCQKSVPESILCFIEGDSYEDTVRNAVSLGGDADTQAAIAGSIASAYYDVPENIFGQCLSKLDVNLLRIFHTFNNMFIINKE